MEEVLEETNEEQASEEKTPRVVSVFNDILRQHSGSEVLHRMVRNRSSLVRGNSTDNPELSLESAKKKLLAGVLPDATIYFKSLRPANPLVRASSLQRYIKRGVHLLSGTLRPEVASDGLRLNNLAYDVQSGTLGKVTLPTFRLSFNTAVGVPLPGIEKTTVLRLARVCLFNGTKFIGNTYVIPARLQRTNDTSSAWIFDAGVSRDLIVRSQSMPNLQLYIELNMSFSFDENDEKLFENMSDRVVKSQIDEVCCAWCTIAFPKPEEYRRNKELQVQLCAGRLSPQLVSAVTGKGDGNRCGPMLCGRSDPSKSILNIRIGPVSKAEEAEVGYLPASILTVPNMILLIKLYRTIMASQLCPDFMFMAPKANIVVKYFPLILMDPDITYTFMALWNERLTTLRKKRGFKINSVATSELFSECILRIWPALHLDALPTTRLCNDVTNKRERLRLLHEFARLPPSETLRDATGVWYHKPFDASETLYNMSEQVGYAT